MNVTIQIPGGLLDMSADMQKNTLAAAKRGLRQGVQMVIGALREASGGGILHRRTGELAGSWKGHGVEADAGGFTGKIGSQMAYAEIQNDGTVGAGGTMPTIVPVKAKVLTIPYGENLTARGVPRFPTVADLRAKFGDKNVFLRKGGNILFAKTGKSEKTIRAYFVFSKKVDIKPTHYIDKTLEAQSDTVRERIGTEIAVAQIMGKRDE